MNNQVNVISSDIEEAFIVPEVSNKYLTYYLPKRFLDIILASALLVFLAPLFLLVAILIKLDSPGPVFFVHTRAGSKRRIVDGQEVWELRPFSFYKFRSMTHNASETAHLQHIRDYMAGKATTEDGKPQLKVKNDSRVTRIGHLIRRTSIDELPQLVNVLKGDMSLVGPRPVPQYEFDEYQRIHYQRMGATPGITGSWQVNGRCTLSFEQQMALDIDYVLHKNLWLDFKILALTLPAVISGEGVE